MSDVSRARLGGQAVFREAAIARAWGTGAERERYARLSAFVRRVLERSGADRLVELGCGRAGLAVDAVAAGARYVGVDFVAEAVAAGRESFGEYENIAFRCADARRLDADVVAGSVVVVKEVLQHLSTASARAILGLAAAAPIALVVEDSTAWNLDANREIEDGAYRPIHLQRAPFDGFGFEPLFHYDVDGCSKQVWFRTDGSLLTLGDLAPSEEDQPVAEDAEPVVGSEFRELGDNWALLSRVVELALESGRSLAVSTRPLDGAESIERMMHELLSVMDTAGVRVRLVDRPRNAALPHQSGGFSVWSHGQPYRPTRVRWRAERVRPVACVQLDSRVVRDGRLAEEKGNWSNPYRLLPPEWSPEIRAMLEGFGLTVVELDKRLTLAECVDRASQAALFVGICSGMSHLCHSVGVPMALYGGHGTLPSGEPYSNRGAHRGKVYREFRSLDDLRAIVTDTLATFGWTTGSEDAP